MRGSSASNTGTKGWRRSKGFWQILVGIASIVGAVVGILTFLGAGEDDGTDEPSALSGSPSGPKPSPSARPETTQPEPPPEREEPLDSLRVITGDEWLVELPSDLAGDPTYDGATVIACPSNTTGETESNVSYDARFRFEEFQARLTAYRAPAEDVPMQLHVFADPEDSESGARGGGTPAEIVELTAGQSGQISANIASAYFLRLHVECDLPGGLLILTDATVRG